MKPAQFVPIVCMIGEILLRLRLPGRANFRQSAPVTLALFSERNVESFRLGEKPRNVGSDGRSGRIVTFCPEEYPAALAPTFGKAGIA